MIWKFQRWKRAKEERATVSVWQLVWFHIWQLKSDQICQIWCFTFEIWSDLSDSTFHVWNLRVCQKIVSLISHIHRCWTLECAWFPGIVRVIVKSGYLILITNGVSHYNLFQQTLHFIGDCLSLNQRPAAAFPAGRFKEFSIFWKAGDFFQGELCRGAAEEIDPPLKTDCFLQSITVLFDLSDNQVRRKL